MKTANQNLANPTRIAKYTCKKMSLNRCLLVLGAPQNEVFFKSDNKSGSRITGKPQRSFRNQLSKAEIYDWAKWLRKKALVINHPDAHLYRKEYFTERSKEISEAFNRLVNILENR